MATFDFLERLGGDPLDLFTFRRDQTIWRLTTNAAHLTVPVWDDLAFTPAIIGRGRITRSSETGAIRIPIKIGRTVPIVDALRERRRHPMRCSVHRWQPDAAATPARLAFGTIKGVVFKANGWVECDLVTGESDFETLFPDKAIARTCQKSTFDVNCGLAEGDFSLDTTITDITGSIATVASVGLVPDGWYANGKLKIGREEFFVAAHAGSALTIFEPMPLDVIAAVASAPVACTIVAGDDKSLTTCLTKFNNVLRFLGFDELPDSDPVKTGLFGQGVPGPDSGGGVTAGPALRLHIDPEIIETADTATIRLHVEDPDHSVVSVQAQYNHMGFADKWTDWEDVTPDDDGIYTLSTTKAPGRFAIVAAKVTYADGTSTMGFKTLNADYPFTFDNVLSASFNLSQEVLEPLVIIDTFGLLAQNGLLARLRITQNRELVVSAETGDLIKLFVEKPDNIGPFTLTLPNPSLDDATGTPLTSKTIDGDHIYVIRVDRGTFYWTTLL